MKFFLLPIGMVLLVIAMVFGAAELSTRSASCMLCHRQEGAYANWMTEKARRENRGFAHEMIACADCHMKDNPRHTMASRFRSLLHLIAYVVPQVDPREQGTKGLFNSRRVPSGNCQYCHYGSVYRKAVYLKDLPESLKKIGLVMDHRKHVLTRDKTCHRCHERYKSPDQSAPDKTVNYAEVNHMSCDSCHSYASHAYRLDRLFPLSDVKYEEARKQAWQSLSANPRWMVAIPSEKTCRRCHNGQIHYKTRIFPAECRTGANYDNCVKCHPLMTRSYFDDYLREKGIAGKVPDAIPGAEKSLSMHDLDNNPAAYAPIPDNRQSAYRAVNVGRSQDVETY